LPFLDLDMAIPVPILKDVIYQQLKTEQQEAVMYGGNKIPQAAIEKPQYG